MIKAEQARELALAYESMSKLDFIYKEIETLAASGLYSLSLDYTYYDDVISHRKALISAGYSVHVKRVDDRSGTTYVVTISW